MIKLFNDIDDIYINKDVIEKDGVYICPICNHKAKRETTIQKHFVKKDCHTYKDIFKNTQTEKDLFNLYRTLLTLVDNNVRGFGIEQFRKQSSYTILAKFFLFCFTNKISMDSYTNFCLDKFFNSVANPFIAISCGIKETVLQDFMLWRRMNGKKIDSIKFFEKNRSIITTDTSFALRILERGDVDIETFFQNLDFDSFITKLNNVQKTYLEIILSGGHVEL